MNAAKYSTYELRIRAVQALREGMAVALGAAAVFQLFFEEKRRFGSLPSLNSWAPKSVFA